jgi:beta-lactamase regulating signal transducer with metallopeptidase domain
MAVEILTALIGLNLALGAAILLAALLRRPVRRLFGARVAYGLWLLAPLAGSASLLPPRQANALLVEPAPLRPIAQYTVERIDTVLSLSQGELALLAAWGLGALLAVGFLTWRQFASMALLGRLTAEAPDLIRAANPAVGPAVIGVIRPRIILPADFETRFDDRERTVIMAHERAHLAAWDVRINALLALARCILWFNPLIHLAAHLVRIDQEIACDETVVARHPGDRRAYAQALLKAQVKPAPLPLGCYWPARSPHLKERLLMLTRKSPSRRVRLAGTAMIALGAMGVAYAAWAAQPQEVVAQAAGPVIQLAQAEAPVDGSPHVVRRVTINKNGETTTYEGDAIPAEIQAELEAAEGDGAHKIVRIIRHGDAAAEIGDAAIQRDVLVHKLAEAGGDVRILRVQCTRTADGSEPVCTTLEGDPAEAAAAIEKLKSGADGLAGDVRVLRLQR